MPEIYEILGYPACDRSLSVMESRRKAYCPFMNSKCDGGGNRFMSEIDLSEHEELQKMFTSLPGVPSGICSIRPNPDAQPWIICPRRLLYMGKNAPMKGGTQTVLLEKCGFPEGTKIGIWPEVKIKYRAGKSNFDYTFDYVMMSIDSLNGVKDSGSPVIVEVMTSSTSGGNKIKRSCIPQAFEDCMLGRRHSAPGINYRQVWARMASQLLVKSQAAMSWGGTAIWVLQDVLADYISSTTALNLEKLKAENTSEVNILAFSYGQKHEGSSQGNTVPLSGHVLYSGTIIGNNDNESKPCFQDIILASVCPPRSTLVNALTAKPPANTITV